MLHTALRNSTWLFAAAACVLWLGGGLSAAAETPPTHTTVAPLLIGAEDNWAPFSSADNGQPTGMAVDLVRAIFEEAGIPIQLVSVPYARCMIETKAGRLAGCFDTLPDAQMRRDYLFHAKPLFSDTLLILARADSTESQLRERDLENKVVLITHGYSYGDAFESNSRIKRMKSVADLNVLRMLARSRGDYAVVYQRILAYQLRGSAKELTGQLKAVGRLEDAHLFLSFSRAWPHIDTTIERFNAAHDRLLRSGRIAKIQKQWD